MLNEKHLIYCTLSYVTRATFVVMPRPHRPLVEERGRQPPMVDPGQVHNAFSTSMIPSLRALAASEKSIVHT